MITFLGWATFTIGGAWLVGGLTFVALSLGASDIGESVLGFWIALVAAILWMCFALWLSPISVSA